MVCRDSKEAPPAVNRGHRLVDVPTGLAILRDCLAAIQRHMGGAAEAAR